MDIIRKNINIRKRRGRPYAWCSEEETEDWRDAGRGPDPNPKPVQDGASAQRVPAVAPTAPAGVRVSTLGRGMGGGVSLPGRVLGPVRLRLRKPGGGGHCSVAEGLPALTTA